jgi:hypothetical protein
LLMAEILEDFPRAGTPALEVAASMEVVMAVAGITE